MSKPIYVAWYKLHVLKCSACSLVLEVPRRTLPRGIALMKAHQKSNPDHQGTSRTTRIVEGVPD